MFFRFGSALVLVVLISLVGVAIEKRNLELRRGLSRQHYRMDALHEQYAHARLKTQQLGAPERLIESIDASELKARRPESPVEDESRRVPLLHWQRAMPRTK